MLYAFFAFILFLLLVQFAVSLLPILLPVLLLLWGISLFRKPNVRVYTHTFSFPENTPGPAEPAQSASRMHLEDIIDAEYSERDETAA